MATIYGENYETCPFNASHRIIAWRMSKHIQKCKLSHPDAKTAACRFNSTHIVAETDIAAHENTCKDRIKLDSFVYRSEDTNVNIYPISNQAAFDDDEETWDNENTETYNPQEYCEKNKIIRRLDCMPASARKNFRLEERRRFQQLQETKPQSLTNAQVLAQRRPKTQPLCMAPLAPTIEPQQIVQQMQKLDLTPPKTDTSSAITDNNKNKEDEFIMVKSAHRGRGRRGVTNK